MSASVIEMPIKQRPRRLMGEADRMQLAMTAFRRMMDAREYVKPLSRPEKELRPRQIGEFRYHFQGRRVLFREHGQDLTTRHTKASVTLAMVERAQDLGMKTLKVTGTTEFRRQAWLYGTLHGLDVSGYEASDLDRKRLEMLKKAHNRLNASKDSDSIAVDADNKKKGAEKDTKSTQKKNPNLDPAQERVQMVKDYIARGRGPTGKHSLYAASAAEILKDSSPEKAIWEVVDQAIAKDLAKKGFAPSTVSMMISQGSPFVVSLGTESKSQHLNLMRELVEREGVQNPNVEELVAGYQKARVDQINSAKKDVTRAEPQCQLYCETANQLLDQIGDRDILNDARSWPLLDQAIARAWLDAGLDKDHIKFLMGFASPALPAIPAIEDQERYFQSVLDVAENRRSEHVVGYLKTGTNVPGTEKEELQSREDLLDMIRPYRGAQENRARIFEERLKIEDPGQARLASVAFSDYINEILPKETGELPSDKERREGLKRSLLRRMDGLDSTTMREMTEAMNTPELQEVREIWLKAQYVKNPVSCHTDGILMALDEKVPELAAEVRASAIYCGEIKVDNHKDAIDKAKGEVARDVGVLELRMTERPLETTEEMVKNSLRSPDMTEKLTAWSDAKGAVWRGEYDKITDIDKAEEVQERMNRLDYGREYMEKGERPNRPEPMVRLRQIRNQMTEVDPSKKEPETAMSRQM